MARITLLLALVWSSIVLADRSCGLELLTEFLLLQPTRCDMQFAVLDPQPYISPATDPQQNSENNGPSGQIQGVSPDYSPGFRLAAGIYYSGRCKEVRAIYSRLHTTDSKRIEPVPPNGGIWASGLIISDVSGVTPPAYFQPLLFTGTDTNEIAAFSEGRSRHDYDAGELQVAVRWMVGCRLWTRAFAGLHYANLDQLFEADYQGTLHPGGGTFEALQVFGNVQRVNKSWGIGPRLGIESCYDLFCGFGLCSHLSGGLLGGNRQARYFQRYIAIRASDLELINDRTWDVSSSHETLVAPMLNARLGVHGLLSIACCFYLNLEVGYEWLSYVNFQPRGPHFRIDKGISVMDCTSFDLSGLYVTVMGTF